LIVGSDTCDFDILQSLAFELLSTGAVNQLFFLYDALINAYFLKFCLHFDLKTVVFTGEN
jgi:hypothetical protein